MLKRFYRKLHHIWFKERPGEMALSRASFIACTFVLFFGLWSQLEIGRALDDYLGRKAEFSVRSILGRDPPLSSKLKIFIYDDQTVSMAEGGDVELKDWASVFESLAAAGAAHVVVDKIFDLPKNLAQAADFSERVGRLKTPILTGGFITTSEIPSRAEVELDQPWNQLLSLRDLSLSSPADSYPLLGPSRIFTYGPHRSLAKTLHHVGHIVYAGSGRVAPLLRIDARTVLPHVSLLLAQKIAVNARTLSVNDTPLSLADERLQVNLASPLEIAQKCFSMKPLILKARSKDNISVVNPGDDVVILPAMYTGNTDWFTTPAGQLPGGYIVVSMVNSVLTNQWLSNRGSAGISIVLAALLASLFTLRIWGHRYWLGLGGICLGICAYGLGSFAFLGTIVPWLYPANTFLLTSLTLFAERTRLARIHQVKLDKELETAGLVQRALFPKHEQKLGILKVQGYFQPASECGGDWWWHFAPTPGIEYVMIGDAMGHGVPAALVTGLMYASLNTLTDLWQGNSLGALSPAKILQLLNRILYSALEGEVFMTMFVARFDTHNGILTFANAGHRFPLLFPEYSLDLRQGEKLRPASRKEPTGAALLTAAGNVLGVASESSFQERHIEIKAKDKFVFYTDGIVEQLGEDGRQWGQKAFIACASSLVPLPAEGILDGIIAAMQARLPLRSQEDDHTLVVVEIPAGWQSTTEAKKVS